MLARTLISRPNVETLLRNPALQLDVPSPAARETVMSRLMEQIKIAPTLSDNLYEISYRGKSPEPARRLVEATLDLFVHAGAGAKKQDSQAAGQFIEAQIRSYEAKLIEAEGRLKDFKIRHFGVSGVPSQDYFTRVSELTDEVNKLRVELRAAEQSRDAYRRELSAEDPQLPADLVTKDSNPINSPVLEAEARLDAQKKSLDELLRRYTDAHPDVISTRRAIGQLELEVRTRQEAEQRRLAKLGKATKAATSPVYQKLRISLADTEAQVASLRSRLAAQQGQLDRVRSVAGRLPQVEAELAQLNRDYDIIRKNYDLMVARRESASLGVKLDESAQLAEFRVIEPPRVSPSPIFPSRLHLALIAVVASMALGLAAALASEFMSPTIDEATSLQLFSGRPVLGTVSKLVTPQGRRAQRMSLLLFAAAVAALMALQALWVASMAAKVLL
jgi:polysaccharide chain length determinant protein (PEP-CTERM system associated)